MYKKTLSIAMSTALLSTSFLAFSTQQASAAEIDSNSLENVQTNEIVDFTTINDFNYTIDPLTVDQGAGGGVGTPDNGKYTGFYATPAQAEKNGKTFHITKSIPRSEVVKVKDFATGKETNASVVLSGTAGLMASAIPIPVVGMVTGAAITAITYGLTTLLPTQGKAIDKLLDNSTAKYFTIDATYEYKRHGSNDGMYVMTVVTVK
ncbi:hypothetical protein ACIQXI_00675 [Lysinibacillus sp. NPDC097195]|uniref:hypothetical protein n=1 Tax=Lysinibacillus sp. NPDC097195 TaxID=3364141 RepID=UPI003802D730